ncbi:unnamed protein product [Linum trigynum]|uniref:Uncharacterized protein n=1 Tax=Linum trigynum TaxID=586398 RepID=A0AAV2FYJ2_9ROSI
MSSKSSSGAPSTNPAKEKPSEPDVLQKLEGHFSPDPLREKGAWTPRTKSQASSKGDAPSTAMPLSSQTTSANDTADKGAAPTSHPSVNPSGDAAAPSNPKPSKFFLGPAPVVFRA